MATKSFIKTIGEKGLLADYNTEGKKLQTQLTFDSEPTAGSNNPVTSDGIKTALSNKEDAFNVLPTTKGGTGTNAASKTELTSTLINSLSTESSTPSDADFYISQYVGGGTAHTSYHRRAFSTLWDYIKGKISSVLGLTASAYSGKAATAGTADKAVADNSGNDIETTYATKTETEEAISNSVDQTYSPTSTKAQSGVAVNEAFKTRETSVSDDSYTYLGMSLTYTGKELLYWKLVSFKPTYNYWTLQFEIDVSNGKKYNGSYDTEIYETKRLTICGKTPGSVEYAKELRYVVQGIDASRGYGNNIYYDISSSNLVTVYIKAIDYANKTQICRLKDVINVKSIANITWYEPVSDAGPQPTNPVKFKEFFPSIASTSSDIGSASVPVYVNKGKPVSCNPSNLKAGKDDDGNVIKNTYQKKLTFDTKPTNGSSNPVTSDGIRTMHPLSHRFDNETSSRLIIWGKYNNEGYITDIVRKFGLQYGSMTDFLFTNSVHKDNTTSIILKILNASSRPLISTKRLKASIFKDSSENSYFALWLDGSISQPAATFYADYYPDFTEKESLVRHFTVFNPSEYTLVRDLTIKYIPLALPTPSAGVLTSDGSSNSWLTPPASGTAILKSVNGVIQWVTE